MQASAMIAIIDEHLATWAVDLGSSTSRKERRKAVGAIEALTGLRMSLERWRWQDDGAAKVWTSTQDAADPHVAPRKPAPSLWCDKCQRDHHTGDACDEDEPVDCSRCGRVSDTDPCTGCQPRCAHERCSTWVELGQEFCPAHTSGEP